ncbi:MAG: hypothetical protein AVDCRST_MAG70-1732 [uncultured Thermomicrobiales bacterium]|uniref:HTH arsR-type domain-containing protein n=1 Tax=uncultured Thermomicrobiales bacterium TaxID=1645740 RepID=A0A6J4UVT6_9BACT|nr:MAG: hypothetical protein AVDCRST_MAG70-1732 [uncultured Thermomicrobiales bacterium]
MNAHPLLAELFSSKVRAAVLEWMIPRPHLGASLTDLSRLLGLPVSSLQHECYKLERLGILSARRSGNARLYRSRPDCPILPPLAALVAAVIGPVAMLRAALEGVAGIDAAFVAGTLPGIQPDDRPGQPGDPISSGSGTPSPRPRLVIVGDLSLDTLDAVLGRAETALGLPAGSLELAYFRLDDWHERRTEGSPFVQTLIGAPRLSLVGII